MSMSIPNYQQEKPCCSSCGVPYDEHLGLESTCAKEKALRKELTRVWDICEARHKRITQEHEAELAKVKAEYYPYIRDGVPIGIEVDGCTTLQQVYLLKTKEEGA